MYASVVPFRVKAGRTEEAVQTYLGSVIPAIREQRGFRSILVLTDPETNEGYGISLWDTEEDAKAFGSSGNYREQVIGKLGNLLVEPPARKIYEVSIQM